MDMFDKVSTEQRLAAIEAKLDAIIGHFGIPYPRPEGLPPAVPSRDPRTMPEVVDHVRRGKQISAIKAYRERTGAGLAEAKKAVDALAAQLKH
ncbi:ribosomal protein L7/L12 [Kitasatospora sp. NPDC093550]|uniref:ribosomal protein L7/L12 n=1 Tax=Kitasatospora sp. NPDC093550 TaxID=3364089 RepID=UPI0037FA3AD7